MEYMYSISISSGSRNEMAEAAQRKVSDAVQSLMDDLDKSHMRRIQVPNFASIDDDVALLSPGYHAQVRCEML